MTTTMRGIDALVDRLVGKVHKATAGKATTWTVVNVMASDDDRRIIDAEPGRVSGRLPMGWRITGPTGTLDVTIRRELPTAFSWGGFYAGGEVQQP